MNDDLTPFARRSARVTDAWVKFADSGDVDGGLGSGATQWWRFAVREALNLQSVAGRLLLLRVDLLLPALHITG